jgi:hypothetical protein
LSAFAENETAVIASTNHSTAESRFVRAAGVVAYRRFGRPADLPLVLLQHYRGNLDNWDPALTDALAAKREIILVDYPGAGSSTGEASSTIAKTARQMIAFVGGSTASGLTCSGSRSVVSSPRRSRSCGRRSSARSSSPQRDQEARRGCTAGPAVRRVRPAR